MGPSGTGLYTWTPARHTSGPDSAAAHRRHARRLARQGTQPQRPGRTARLGAWLDQYLHVPALR